jgi:hypothetical protein
MKRIHLISTPRNLSTAFMYSWAQRKDCTVYDEPFYAYYLEETGIDHPGRTETLHSMPRDIETIKSEILFGDYSTPMVFLKDMAQHLINMDLSFIKELENIIYIRNPKQVIASFAKVIPNPTINDIGIKNTLDIYNYLDKDAIVLDSSELLKDPKSIWQQLCDRLNIDFDPAVLKWEAGARPEDGVWSKYWYANVHQTNGFKKQRTSESVLPKHLENLNEEAQEYYKVLIADSIKA